MKPLPNIRMAFAFSSSLRPKTSSVSWEGVTSQELYECQQRMGWTQSMCVTCSCWQSIHKPLSKWCQLHYNFRRFDLCQKHHSIERNKNEQTGLVVRVSLSCYTTCMRIRKYIWRKTFLTTSLMGSECMLLKKHNRLYTRLNLAMLQYIYLSITSQMRTSE